MPVSNLKKALVTAASVFIVAQVVWVTGPEKMAMVPPLQEAAEMEREPELLPLSFRLYMPDPAAGRDSVRLFVTEKLNGDFLETEIPNTLFFRISADRLDELRDGLFEFGSFEQASESEPREGSVSVSLEILPERDS